MRDPFIRPRPPPGAISCLASAGRTRPARGRRISPVAVPGLRYYAGHDLSVRASGRSARFAAVQRLWGRCSGSPEASTKRPATRRDAGAGGGAPVFQVSTTDRRIAGGPGPFARCLALLVAGLAAGAGAQTTSLQQLSGIADGHADTTVYVAREIITMDPSRPRAEAVAVRDGRFVAVGSRAEVEQAAGPDARLDETFARKVVVPGFIEPHVHPVLAALTMSTEVIAIEEWHAIGGLSPAVRDAEGYRERLLQALADHHRTGSGAFVTWGYHHDFHGEMSQALLDELLPNVPVIVWHRSCHAFYLNGAALAAAGIDADVVAGLTPSQQAQIDLEEGQFHEQGAIAILDRLAPLLASPERLRRGLELTEVEYHRNGITLACEPGGFLSRPLQEAINAVYSDSATPFNHCFIADGKTLAARHPHDPKALIDATRQVLTWGDGRTRYLPQQVKLFTDGGIYNRRMQLRDGYTDGHTGAWIMDPPAFDAAFQAYWDAGYQIHVHSNGDGGLEVLLASLEQAMARAPRADHRTVLVHFGFAEPEQVARWAELGGIVSASPYHVTALAARYAKHGIGEPRAANMVPMAEVLKHGMPFSFRSSMPMAPAKPLLLVYAAVNRLTAEGRIMGPEHKVPREAALRAVTLGAAHAIRQEDVVGSIEVSKRADLTILEANPLDVPPTWIKDIPVWGTMLEGRVQPVPAAPPARSAGPSMPDPTGGTESARAASRRLGRLIGIHQGH